MLTPRFRAGSDVDVLVEFDPDHLPRPDPPLAGMEFELSASYRAEESICEQPEDLSRYFRNGSCGLRARSV